MSMTIPSIDLSTLTVGKTSSFNLQNVGVGAGAVSAHPANTNKFGTLRMHNESGTGLNVAFKTSNSSFNLPAGGWVDATCKPGESDVVLTALYTLASPPAQTLLLTYYFPGEPVPPMTQLGNSPIGGTAATSLQTLSNEGSSVGTEVIDIGTATNNKNIDIFNDHFTLKVEQAGVAHTVLTGRTTGKPGALGQAGDHTEVMGTLDVDQNLFIVGTSSLDNGVITTDGSGNVVNGGTITLPNLIYYQAKDTGGTARPVLRVNGSNGVEVKGITGSDTINMQTSTGVGIVQFASGGISLQSGAFNGLTGDGLARLGSASGTGSGTFSHSTGATPDFVAITTHTNGSQTVGYNAETSTQITVTTGAGLAWFALCTKRS